MTITRCDRCQREIDAVRGNALTAMGKIAGAEGEVLFHIGWVVRDKPNFHLCRLCAAMIVRAALIEIFSCESVDGEVPPMPTRMAATAEKP